MAVTFEDWERERLDHAVGVVCTLGPDGAPYAAPVIVWIEGDLVRFETEAEARKYRNLVSDPRVAVCVYGSPKWGVVVRGTASVVAEAPAAGANAQIAVHPVTKSTWRRKEG
jgi:nitroimidazol reductase NimA-like FMN-containing flavoprotein (pyridoxamine 5'-phosphate oxidase superfamily)